MFHHTAEGKQWNWSKFDNSLLKLISGLWSDYTGEVSMTSHCSDSDLFSSVNRPSCSDDTILNLKLKLIQF